MKKLLTVFLLLSFAIFLIFMTVFPLEDSDIWFHLKAGEWMWENKALASPDPFSYAIPNLGWVNLEWGLDVVLYLIEKIAGLNAIIIAKAILITVTFLLLVVFQKGLSPILRALSMGILTVGVIASADRFMERVEHVGYFFLVVELGILFWWKTILNTNQPFVADAPQGKHENEHKKTRNFKIQILLMPIIFFLWSNMHPSFVLGMALFAMFVFTEFAACIMFWCVNYGAELRQRNIIFKRILYRTALSIKRLFNPEILSLKPLLILVFVLIISFGASLINPYGNTQYGVVLSLGAAGGGGGGTAVSEGNIYLSTLIEWQSPFDRGQRDTIYVQAYLWTLGLYWLAFIIGSIKNGIRLSYLAILSFITYLSFTAVRQINIFVIVGFLPAVGTLNKLTPNNTNKNTNEHERPYEIGSNYRKRRLAVRVFSLPIRVYSCIKDIGFAGLASLILSIGFTAASIYIIRNGYQLGRIRRTFSLGKREIYATNALKFLDENNIYGNMYNAYGPGGYLIYAGYPKRKVFIDGRAHYPEEFFAQHGSVATSSAQAKFVMDKYKIDYVVIMHPETGSKVLADHLSNDRKNWALIYWDQYYLVYVRRIPYKCKTRMETNAAASGLKQMGANERMGSESVNIGYQSAEIGSKSDVIPTKLEERMEGSSKLRKMEDSSTSLGMTIEVYCANWSDVVAKNEYTYGDPVLLRRPEKLEELSRPGKEALKPKVRTAGELNRNLDLVPENNRARIMLGGIFELIPDLTEAQKVYEEAVKRDPKFSMSRFLLGNILLRRAGEGITNNELRISNQGEENSTESAQIQNITYDIQNTIVLSNGQKVSKDIWDRAKQEFQTSFNLDPTVSSPLVTLGIMFQQEGELDEAVKYWTKASNVAPADPQAFYQLGILYSNERFDREKALYYLQRFVTLASGDDQRVQRASVILERLKH